MMSERSSVAVDQDKRVLHGNAALRAAAAQAAPAYSWVAGASIAGLLLAAAPFLLDTSALAAAASVMGAVASVAIWYITAGRNPDGWRILARGPATIEGAPLRRLLDGSKR